jgi:hypothetical protein
MCPKCVTFAVDLEIHGPRQLRRIVAKLQVAVSEKLLWSVAEPETSSWQHKPDFSQLDLSDTLPDAMSYQLECCACGQAFELRCESYHGSGGSAVDS